MSYNATITYVGYYTQHKTDLPHEPPDDRPGSTAPHVIPMEIDSDPNENQTFDPSAFNALDTSVAAKPSKIPRKANTQASTLLANITNQPNRDRSSQNNQASQQLRANNRAIKKHGNHASSKRSQG